MANRRTLEKRKILLDSVRKLMALQSVSERDILENLKSVGVSEKEARELVAEAKSDHPARPAEEHAQKPAPKPAPHPDEKKPGPAPKPAEKKEKEVPAKKTEEPPKLTPAQIAQKNRKVDSLRSLLAQTAATPKPSSGFQKAGAPKSADREEKHEAPKPPAAPHPAKTPAPAAPKENAHANDAPAPKNDEKPARRPSISPDQPAKPVSVDFSKLWESGLMTTIDAKLEEMRRLKRDIDAVIDLRIDEKVDAESKKISALFESQRQLFTGKINASLEDKSKEVEDIITTKIAELKETDASIKQNLSKLDARKAMATQLLQSVKESIAELEATQSRLKGFVNAQVQQSHETVDAFVKDAQKKLVEVDTRVSKTLELESKIAEGLVKNAENKIGEIVSIKTQGIDSRLESRANAIENRVRTTEKRLDAKMNELNAIQERVDPKMVEQKLNELVETAKADVTAQANEVISQKASALEREVDEKIMELDAVQKTLNPQKIAADIQDLQAKFERDASAMESRMNDLNDFKDQFIAIISKNTQSFNKSVKEFNERRTAFEQKAQKSIKEIDEKLAELDAFEKEFAEEMGVIIDKASAKGGAKKESAPKTGSKNTGKNAGKKKKK